MVSVYEINLHSKMEQERNVLKVTFFYPFLTLTQINFIFRETSYVSNDKLTLPCTIVTLKENHPSLKLQLKL